MDHVEKQMIEISVDVRKLGFEVGGLNGTCKANSDAIDRQIDERRIVSHQRFTTNHKRSLNEMDTKAVQKRLEDLETELKVSEAQRTRMTDDVAELKAAFLNMQHVLTAMASELKDMKANQATPKCTTDTEEEDSALLEQLKLPSPVLEAITKAGVKNMDDLMLLEPEDVDEGITRVEFRRMMADAKKMKYGEKEEGSFDEKDKKDDEEAQQSDRFLKNERMRIKLSVVNRIRNKMNHTSSPTVPEALVCQVLLRTLHTLNCPVAPTIHDVVDELVALLAIKLDGDQTLFQQLLEAAIRLPLRLPPSSGFDIFDERTFPYDADMITLELKLQRAFHLDSEKAKSLPHAVCAWRLKFFKRLIDEVQRYKEEVVSDRHHHPTMKIEPSRVGQKALHDLHFANTLVERNALVKHSSNWDNQVKNLNLLANQKGFEAALSSIKTPDTGSAPTLRLLPLPWTQGK